MKQLLVSRMFLKSWMNWKTTFVLILGRWGVIFAFYDPTGLGLEPSEVNELDRRSEREGTDIIELLLEECFKKEKIKSWHQFVTVLEKPALAQNNIVKDIRSRFLRQCSSESDSSLPSPMSVQCWWAWFQLPGSFVFIKDGNQDWTYVNLKLILNGCQCGCLIINCFLGWVL